MYEERPRAGLSSRQAFLGSGRNGNCLNDPECIAVLYEVCFEVLDTVPAEAFETAL
jgi:hypothetical protein